MNLKQMIKTRPQDQGPETAVLGPSEALAALMAHRCREASFPNLRGPRECSAPRTRVSTTLIVCLIAATACSGGDPKTSRAMQAPTKESVARDSARMTSTLRGADTTAGGKGTAAADTSRPPADTASAPAVPPQPPLVTLYGWLARGDYEDSFQECGKKAVHFVRPVGPAAGSLITQHYRFRALRPLTAVYFAFRGRIADDTVTLGPHVYTTTLRVQTVLPETRSDDRKCSAPPSGSLIARVQRK